MDLLTRIADAYHKLLCASVTLLVGALVVPVTLQIVSRYTSVLPTMMWTEEAARFCLIWTIMLGAGIAVRGRLHFDIDLLPEPRTVRGRVFARMLVDVAVALFGLAFLWIGGRYALEGRGEVSEITEISMAWMYVAFPVSAVGWLLFVLERIVEDVTVLRGSVR